MNVAIKRQLRFRFYYYRNFIYHFLDNDIILKQVPNQWKRPSLTIADNNLTVSQVWLAQTSLLHILNSLCVLKTTPLLANKNIITPLVLLSFPSRPTVAIASHYNGKKSRKTPGGRRNGEHFGRKCRASYLATKKC